MEVKTVDQSAQGPINSRKKVRATTAQRGAQNAKSQPNQAAAQMTARRATSLLAASAEQTAGTVKRRS